MAASAAVMRNDPRPPRKAPTQAQTQAHGKAMQGAAKAVTGTTPAPANAQQAPATQGATASSAPNPAGATPSPNTTQQRVLPNVGPFALPKQQPAKKATGGRGPMGVSTRVHAITNRRSPLMTQARFRAMEQAQRKGMLNSTMAGQAGEAAVISQALEMAKADEASALTRAQLENEQDRFKQSDKLGWARLRHDIVARQNARKNVLDRMKHEARQNLQSRNWQGRQNQLMRQHEARQTLAQRKWQGNQNRLTREQERKQNERQRQWQMNEGIRQRDWQRQENNLQREIQQSTLDTNTKNTALTQIQQANATYANMINAIMNNPDLSPEQREERIQGAKTIRNTMIKNIQVNFRVGTAVASGDFSV